MNCCPMGNFRGDAPATGADMGFFPLIAAGVSAITMIAGSVLQKKAADKAAKAQAKLEKKAAADALAVAQMQAEAAAAQMQAEATKSSRTWIWVGVGAVAVIALAGGVLYARRQK